MSTLALYHKCSYVSLSYVQVLRIQKIKIIKKLSLFLHQFIFSLETNVTQHKSMVKPVHKKEMAAPPCHLIVLLAFYGLKEALCDTNFFSFVFTVLRTRLREKRDIEGNLTMDLLLTALCGYCTLCQVRFILQTLCSHISIEENGNYCSTYNIHTYGKW